MCRRPLASADLGSYWMVLRTKRGELGVQGVLGDGRGVLGLPKPRIRPNGRDGRRFEGQVRVSCKLSSCLCLCPSRGISAPPGLGLKSPD